MATDTACGVRLQVCDGVAESSFHAAGTAVGVDVSLFRPHPGEAIDENLQHGPENRGGWARRLAGRSGAKAVSAGALAAVLSQEDLVGWVGVAAYQGGGAGDEHDAPAGGADRRSATFAVGVVTPGRHARCDGGAGLSVVQQHFTADADDAAEGHPSAVVIDVGRPILVWCPRLPPENPFPALTVSDKR